MRADEQLVEPMLVSRGIELYLNLTDIASSLLHTRQTTAVFRPVGFSTLHSARVY